MLSGSVDLKAVRPGKEVERHEKESERPQEGKEARKMKLKLVSLYPDRVERQMCIFGGPEGSQACAKDGRE